MVSSKIAATPFVAHPGTDRRWGTFAEELLHHTSRYYRYTEVFLRHLGGDPSFTMSGYNADRLSPAQRDLMTAVMFDPPSPHAAQVLMRLVADVAADREQVDDDLTARYREHLQSVSRPSHEPTEAPLGSHTPDPDAGKLDPFLAITRRLQIPVAVNGKRVEICLHVLAQHLDSAVPQIRNNLREAIFWMHEAGYRLKSHPGLTHREAARINQHGPPLR